MDAIFRQLQDRETGTFTYLLADRENRLGFLIDPVLENSDRDWDLIQELDIELRFILETHVHADHVTGAHALRERSGAKVGLSASAGAEGVDLSLEDGQLLELGNLKLQALSTPGHTSGCMSYVVGDRVFTGDALLIRGCGRTDFQEGASAQLYQSIWTKLFALPDQTLVFPGHDYRGLMCSSIGEEKKHNPRLKEGISEPEFIEIMNQLNLPRPKRIDIAVPANLKCGRLN